MSTPIIQFIDVFKSYQNGSQPVTALKGVNLSLNVGDFVTIMGPSGGGKTTLLKAVVSNVLLCQQYGVGFFSGAKVSPYDAIHCYISIPETWADFSNRNIQASQCK